MVFLTISVFFRLKRFMTKKKPDVPKDHTDLVHDLIRRTSSNSVEVTNQPGHCKNSQETRISSLCCIWLFYGFWKLAETEYLRHYLKDLQLKTLSLTWKSRKVSLYENNYNIPVIYLNGLNVIEKQKILKKKCWMVQI